MAKVPGKSSGLASGNTKGAKPAPAKIGGKPAIGKSTKVVDKSRKPSNKTGLS